MSVLDSDKLIRLRTASGLSETQLAQRLGRTHPMIRGLETGRDAEVSLGTAARVAEALGVSLRDLLRKDEGPPPGADRDDADPDSAVLAARIEALLLVFGRTARIPTLIAALQVEEAHVTAALDRLDDQLKGHGIHLIRHGGGRVLLAPREGKVDIKGLRRLESVSAAREGMTLQMARVLFQVWRAQDTSTRTYGLQSPDAKIGHQRLSNAGLIKMDADRRRTVLSDPVMFALEPAIQSLQGQPDEPAAGSGEAPTEGHRRAA